MNPATSAPERSLSKAKAGAVVKEARDRLQESYDHDRDNRREMAIDLQFLAGDQWPEQVRLERERKNRPMLTINRLPQFVRQVTNDVRQADVAIKTSPVDGNSDPELSRIYNGLLRQIQYQSSASHVYATAAGHQVACGIGWFRITNEYTDDTSFEQEIRLRAIPNPLSVYCDPAAVEIDRSDAMWMIVTQEMPKSAFEAQWPDASEDGVDAPADSTSTMGWFGGDTVRVAEYWRKVPVKKTIALTQQGETIEIDDIPKDVRRIMGIDRMPQRVVHTHRVEMYLVTGSDVLSGPHDWPGKHIPIVPVVGDEVPLEKTRYRFGMVRFARDPQQLYNFYRTASAESIALAPKAPYLVTPEMIGPFKGMWDTANTENRPYLLYQPDQSGATPKREHPPETPVALIQETERASEDMKATTGIYDAALGAKSNETSGRAILARQREGDVSNYHYSDNLERALQYAGRVLIDLIPKIYDSQRIIRIMGDDGEEDFVPINHVMYGINGVPQLVNDLSTARFDVRVTIGPSYSTKRMETANSVLEFLRVYPDAAPLVGDLIAKNLDFEGAEDVAKRLKKAVPPQILSDPDDPKAPQPPPPPNPMDDPTVRADVEYKQAQTAKALADAEKIKIESMRMMTGADQPAPEVPQIDPHAAAQSEAATMKAYADAELAQHNARKAALDVENYVSPAEIAERKARMSPPAP